MHKRNLELEGAVNFRDLGGYSTSSGMRVRWRRLFRSDQLGALTQADRASLDALGVTRSFDFRGVEESAAANYEWPGLNRHALAIEPTLVKRLDEMAASGHTLTPQDVERLMQDLYRHLIGEQHHRYAELFEEIASTDSALVFHCTAGKDRTGVAAALLLSALGVSMQTIEEDYLLTNASFRRPAPERSKWMPQGLSRDALKSLWTAHISYLRAAYACIDTEHGGLNRYFTEQLGLTEGKREALAQRLLEPASD